MIGDYFDYDYDFGWWHHNGDNFSIYINVVKYDLYYIWQSGIYRGGTGIYRGGIGISDHQFGTYADAEEWLLSEGYIK